MRGDERGSIEMWDGWEEQTLATQCISMDDPIRWSEVFRHGGDAGMDDAGFGEQGGGVQGRMS